MLFCEALLHALADPVDLRTEEEQRRWEHYEGAGEGCSFSETSSVRKFNLVVMHLG